jgi:hypothetical protein
VQFPFVSAVVAEPKIELRSTVTVLTLLLLSVTAQLSVAVEAGLPFVTGPEYMQVAGVIVGAEFDTVRVAVPVPFSGVAILSLAVTVTVYAFGRMPAAVGSTMPFFVQTGPGPVRAVTADPPRADRSAVTVLMVVLRAVTVQVRFVVATPSATIGVVENAQAVTVGLPVTTESVGTAVVFKTPSFAVTVIGNALSNLVFAIVMPASL